MLQPHGMPFFLITCYLTIFPPFFFCFFFEVFKSNISHSVHSFPFRGGLVHPLTYIHHTSTYQASMCKLMEYWWGRSFCLSYHPAFKDDDMVFYLQHLFQILQLKSCHTFSSGSVEREWDSGKWKWKWNYTWFNVICYIICYFDEFVCSETDEGVGGWSQDFGVWSLKRKRNKFNFSSAFPK